MHPEKFMFHQNWLWSGRKTLVQRLDFASNSRVNGT